MLGDVVGGGGIISEMFLFHNWLRGTKLSYLLLASNYAEVNGPTRPWHGREEGML